jgi:hypothetical protein
MLERQSRRAGSLRKVKCEGVDWKQLSSGMWCHLVWQKRTNVSEEPVTSIFRVEEVAAFNMKGKILRSYKAVVPSYRTTRRHGTEDRDLNTHRRENVTSHMDTTGSEWGAISGFSEHANEPSGSVTARNSLISWITTQTRTVPHCLLSGVLEIFRHMVCCTYTITVGPPSGPGSTPCNMVVSMSTQKCRGSILTAVTDLSSGNN